MLKLERYAIHGRGLRRVFEVEGGDGGGGGNTDFVGSDGTFNDGWTSRDEFKDHADTLGRYKTVGELAKGHMELRKKFSKNPDSMVEIPSETSGDDVKTAWSKAHGRPDTQDLYEYTLSDDHAIKLEPLDDTKMAAFREFGHKKNWSQKDFKDVLDFYHDNMVGDIDTFNTSFEEQKTAAKEKGMAILKGIWLEGTDDRIAGALEHLQKYAEIEVKGADGEMVNPLEMLLNESPELKNSPWFTMILDTMKQKMGEATRKGGEGSGALSLEGINSQIAGIRAQQSAIKEKNPVNYKGDPEFKRLEDSLKVLYQKKPA